MPAENKTCPFISADRLLPEITLKGIILSILLTVILGAANCFLSLRVGVTVSASIPAAVISMGVLRCFRRSNILENNIVQTSASMGEAMTAGLAFILPALVILHFWMGFYYWQTVAISLLAGFLGVLFGVPLRRVLINDPVLRFPEGTAIGSVLKASADSSADLRYLSLGGFVGGLISICQSGFGLLASEVSLWWQSSGVAYGFGLGYSPALIAAGYIVGINVAISVLTGIVVGWLVGIPALSYFYGVPEAADFGMAIWSLQIRYIGVGTMLVGGLWTLIILSKQIYTGVKASVSAMQAQSKFSDIPRTERDIPINIVFWSLLIVLVLIFIFLFRIIDPNILTISYGMVFGISLVGTLYILIVGFILCSVAGYFAGLIGSTNSPGSGLMVAGLLIFCLILLLIFKIAGIELTQENMVTAASLAIVILSIMAASLLVTNETIQDLKAGQIVGATPWKQQLMLILGCVVASFILPLVLQLLFNAYGIGGVFPREGMDPAKMLAAPQAGLMAAVAQGVFTQHLPWPMIIIGVVIGVLVVCIDEFLKKRYRKRLPILAVGLGIYLPIGSSSPIMIGGFLSYFIYRWMAKKKNARKISPEKFVLGEHAGLLLACGVVAGAAVMGVILAIPFAIAKDATVLQFVPSSYVTTTNILSVLVTVGLFALFYSCVKKAVR